MPSVQALAKQLAVALAKLHALSQAPQCDVLFVVFVSQPLDVAPSQFANPELHAMPQVPLEQLGVPFELEQTLPHPPQLLTLLPVLVSQPLLASPSQLPNPTVQSTSSHTPVEQLAVALARAHCTPQAPQSLVVRRLVSQPSLGLPLQSAQPAAHVGAHWPL